MLLAQLFERVPAVAAPRALFIPTARPGARGGEGLGRESGPAKQRRARARVDRRRHICDVGIANHYYLARELEENPDFPVKLAWPNQDRSRRAHQRVGGA